MKHPELLTRSKIIHRPDNPDHEYFLPGYILQKIFFLLFNAAVVGIALLDIAPKLWKMTAGEMTRAEVTGVVKTLPDETEEIFTNDAKAKEASDKEDRSSVYHNILTYRLPDGTERDVRMPTGSRLSPPLDILDSSGLPTIVLIAYSPNQPDRIVLPARLSTWFFPIIILMFGVAAGSVAVMFLMKASTPIEVPHLHAPPGENLADTDEDGPDIDVKTKDE